jgi:hypothetical protein
MKPNPFVWFPHLKFIFWTIAVQYPIKPNEVTIKKYYTLIKNLPVFFPIYPMGNSFSELLDKYPVKPYLDSRKSYMKWNHFIINKINEKLELPQETFYEGLENYYNHYKPKETIIEEQLRKKKKTIYISFIVVLIGAIYLLYNK